MGQAGAERLIPIMVVKEDSLGELFVHGLLSKAVRAGQVEPGQGAY